MGRKMLTQVRRRDDGSLLKEAWRRNLHKKVEEKDS